MRDFFDMRMHATRSMFLAMLLALSFISQANAQCTLCNTSLSFDNPKAGRVSRMTITFALGSPFQQLDEVELKLPQFSRADGTGDLGNVVDPSATVGISAFTLASWNEGSSLLTLTHIVPTTIPAGTLVTLGITAEADIALPLDGVVSNDPSYQIRTDAQALGGISSFESIRSTQAIGVLYNTSLAYDSDVPNGATSLAFNFTYSADLQPGDTIQLFLESFSIPAFATFNSSATICTNPFLTSKTCSIGNISGSAATSSSGVAVLLNFFDTVFELESVTLVIPLSAGISLPTAGTRQNDPLLTIQTDAVAGPVVEHSIEASEYVPRVTLAYDPPKAGTGECIDHRVSDGACLTWVDEGSAVTFSFTYSLAMSANDTIVLVLPNFTRSTLQQSLPSSPITTIPCSTCDVDSFAPTGTSAAVLRDGSWSESSQALTVTFDTAVSPETLISFTVPSSVGLIVPFPSLQDDPDLTYEVRAQAGSLSATSITSSPAVGAFVRRQGGAPYAASSLSMSGPKVGVFAALTLNFTLTRRITEGQCIGFCGTQEGVPIVASVVREVIGPELVTLTLAGFKRAGGDIGLIAIDSDRFGYASWDDSTSELKLTSTSTTVGGTDVSVIIPATAGIMIPRSGLEKNTNSVLIATNAESGPVVNTAVAEVQAVGYLQGTALSVAPLKAGVGVQINVTLSYSQFIAATEKFVLELPGFTRDPSLSPILSVRAWAGGIDFAIYADWVDDGPSINMVVGAGGIRGGSELLVVVSEENEILLREEGMGAIAPRKFWRVSNDVPTPGGWLVAEVAFFSDAACTERVNPLPPVANNVASQGAGLAVEAACTSLSFAPPAQGCGNGTRAATIGELAACREVLCNVNLFPEFLAAAGAGAYVLGRGHGCKVGAGALPASFAGGVDSVCTSAVLPAAHATDNSSQTFWWAGVGGSGNQTGSGQGYVGVEFAEPVAVQCATIEQGLMAGGANYSASSGLVQASDDGVSWWTVLGGPLSVGVSEIKGAVTVDTLAYAAPRLSSDAVRGPVQPTEVAAVPVVGSFVDATALTLGNPTAGEVSSVVVRLVPQMEIAAGESLEIVLAGFTRDAGVVGPLNVTIASYVPTNATTFEEQEAAPLAATWDEATGTVSLVLARTAFPNYTITVTVLESAAMRVPPQGIAPSACGLSAAVQPGLLRQTNGTLTPCGSCALCSGAVENGFTLATNASAGPVLADPGTVIRSVQRVGVISNSSLSPSVLSPDFPVALTLNFTYNRPIAPGVQFFLDLAGFRGTPNATGTATGTTLFGAVAWDRSTQRVTLTVSGTAAARTELSVTVPAELGIQLPAEGLRRDGAELKVSTDSAQGAVQPTTIGASPTVGAFTGDDTRLSYEPAEFETDGTSFGEGRVASIAVGFSLNRRIEVGEHVAVYLVDFSRADGDLAAISTTDHNVSSLDLNFTTVDTNGVFSAFVTASWSEASNTLTLFASKPVAANQRHVVLVPASAGLRLPKVGLVENDPRLLISTNAAAGPNSGTPVRRSPALKKVCSAECSAWAFTCAGCDCGVCAV